MGRFSLCPWQLGKGSGNPQDEGFGRKCEKCEQCFFASLSHRLSVFTFHVQFKNLWYWALPVPNGTAHSCIPTAPQSWKQNKTCAWEFSTHPHSSALASLRVHAGPGSGKGKKRNCRRAGSEQSSLNPSLLHFPELEKHKTIKPWELIPAGIPPWHGPNWESRNAAPRSWTGTTRIFERTTFTGCYKHGGLKKLKDNSPVHKSVRADWSTELTLVKLRLSNFTPQAHQWATENTLRCKLSKVQKAPGLPSVKNPLQSRFSCPAQVGETLHSQGLRNVFAQANKSFISLQTTGKQSN